MDPSHAALAVRFPIKNERQIPNVTDWLCWVTFGIFQNQQSMPFAEICYYLSGNASSTEQPKE